MGSLVTRRSFLSLLAAPAIVHASNIMPVKVIPFDPYMLITGTDMLTNEIVERRIYEDASRADAFLSVDFLNKYERASALLTNIQNAVVESRDQEKAMRFVAPSHVSAYSERGAVCKDYQPVRGVMDKKTFKTHMVGPSDPLFYMSNRELNNMGYEVFA